VNYPLWLKRSVQLSWSTNETRHHRHWKHRVQPEAKSRKQLVTVPTNFLWNYAKTSSPRSNQESHRTNESWATSANRWREHYSDLYSRENNSDAAVDDQECLAVMDEAPLERITVSVRVRGRYPRTWGTATSSPGTQRGYKQQLPRDVSAELRRAGDPEQTAKPWQPTWYCQFVSYRRAEAAAVFSLHRPNNDDYDDHGDDDE